MKVDFQIGTKHHASYFTAKFMYIGRWNTECNALCAMFVKSMQDTFKIAAEEAKITNEQMLKAKAQAEESPIHVWLDVSPIKDTFPCRVTFKPEDVPDGSNPKQVKQAYNFANVLCEYIKEYARQARNGEAPKKYRNIQLQREMPQWGTGER